MAEIVDAWDDEDFTPVDPKSVASGATKWLDEDADVVKEEEEADEKVSTNSVSKSKPKSGKVKKSKEIPKEPGSERELSKAEIEQLQKLNDLKLANELFGDGEEMEEEKLYSKLSSLEEFKSFADRLAQQLLTRERNDNFQDFLSHLFYKIAENLESRDTRRLSTELKTIADLRANQEKNLKKQQQTSTKPTVKPSVKQTKTKPGLYDDYMDSNAHAGGYDDIDDDFM